MPECQVERLPVDYDSPLWREKLVELGLHCVGTMMDLLAYMSPQKMLRFKQYMELRNAMVHSDRLDAGDAFVCNLEQRPLERPHCGKYLGCLTKAGDWWSARKGM